MTAYKLGTTTARPTLSDLLDATLASRDAFTRAAATVSSVGSGEVLARQAREQSHIAACISAHIASATTSANHERVAREDDASPMHADHDAPHAQQLSALQLSDRRTPVMAVLLEAILESRRSYKLAMTLARHELLPAGLVGS